jgi:transketolase
MTNTKSLRKKFAQTSLSLAESDPKVVVLVGDISHGLFSEFRKKFPERYLNVGILEPGMASIAAGLSMVGLRPIVHTIAPFLIERSFEQLKLDFSYQGLSGLFVSVGGAFDYSNLGCTHHSYIDLALMASLDGSRVITPCTEEELSTLMHQSHADWQGLTYIKLTENGLEHYQSNVSIEIGKPVPIISRNSTLAVISVGPTFVQVRDAIDSLEHIEPPSHIHVHTVKPVDMALLDNLLGDATAVLVVEQAMAATGLAARLALHDSWSKPRTFRSIGLKAFVRNYGTYEELLQSSGIDYRAIAKEMSALTSSALGRDAKE